MNERKRHVILTAQQLFKDKGFANTSLQDIINQSNISKGTFYNYFSSKNEFFIAILEYVHEEESIRRDELLIGQDRANKQIFAEQISIRLQTNREYHLLPIFEAIFHSGDSDLKHFTKKHYLLELSWMKKRLIDIYGEQARPHASDGAVILYGMIQHIMHAWTAWSKVKVDIQKLMTFTLNRLDAVMNDLMQSKEVFLSDHILFSPIKDTYKQAHTKKQLLEQLLKFKQAVAKETKAENMQYINFIIEELEIDTPRLFVLKTVLQSFRQSFIGATNEIEARKLANNIWTFIHKEQR